MNSFLTKLSTFKERYDYPDDKAKYMADYGPTSNRADPTINSKYIKDGLEIAGHGALLGGLTGGLGYVSGPLPLRKMGIGAGIGAGLGAALGFHDIKQRYKNSKIPVETRKAKTEEQWQGQLADIHDDEDYYAKWRPKHPTEAKMTSEQARAHYQQTPENIRWTDLDRHAMESQEYHTGDVEDDWRNQRYFHKDYARPHVAVKIIAKHGDPHDYYGMMHYEHGEAHPDIVKALEKLEHSNSKEASENMDKDYVVHWAANHPSEELTTKDAHDLYNMGGAHRANLVNYAREAHEYWSDPRRDLANLPSHVKKAAEYVYNTMPVKSAKLVLAAHDATDNLEAKLAFEVVGRRLVKEAMLGFAIKATGKKLLGTTVTNTGLVGVSAGMKSGESNSLAQPGEGGAQ